MANKKDIKDLVVCAFRGTNPDPTKFSNEDIRKTLRKRNNCKGSHP